MPFANIANVKNGNAGGLRLHYQLEGTPGAPVLVLSNSLGTNLSMWEPQMPALLENFQVLRYDGRGHGQSTVTPGPYNIAQLAGDVVALMDYLEIGRAHFCGLSMGGMIGMWLGAHLGRRLDRLVLCNTAAKIGTAEGWNARIDRVQSEGMAAIVPGVVDVWFTKNFQDTAQLQVGRVRDMLLASPPQGYVANCAAVRDMDQREAIAAVTVPTLVIAGRHDTSTPPEAGRFVADKIKGARFVELNAAHLSNWEVAQAFTSQVLNFLDLKNGSNHG
ncbi:MAG: 3-oxoadipate enol-lactonase [Herminiimonas sp.]|nr:3-oxoadipate enol-lactonase [Herminiimonas sp.]